MGRRTPLYDRHVALGARMVDFSGWDMPVQYKSGILREHEATRTRCGLFDTCHMGEFLIKADDVRTALASCLAGDFSKVQNGRARYTFLTHDDGTVIDDAVAMIFSDTKAWLIVNAGDIAGDYAWVKNHLPDGTMSINVSDETGKLDVQGPNAWQVVKDVTGVDLRTMPFYSFIETTWQGVPMVLSRSGYTGEPGAELYTSAGLVGKLWDALLEAGDGEGLAPCGLGARDTLRLEAGMPLYGHELSRKTTPLDAGLGKFVALDKPQDFPGKAALKAYSPKRALVGLRFGDGRVPRAGCGVVRGGKTVGEVTSGAPAPTVGCPVALAYVDANLAAVGTELEVDVRGKAIAARVAALPFYATPALRQKA